MVNRYLVDDLIKLGLWNTEMKDMIIANNGSIQSIEGIPEEIKELYKTVWEIKQKAVIDLARERAPFVCQTQSMNLHFAKINYSVLHSSLFYSWRQKLKTGCYYVRSQSEIQAQQFTIDPKLIEKSKEDKEAQKLICSLKNRESCEMCCA